MHLSDLAMILHINDRINIFHEIYIIIICMPINYLIIKNHCFPVKKALMFLLSFQILPDSKLSLSQHYISGHYFFTFVSEIFPLSVWDSEFEKTVARQDNIMSSLFIKNWNIKDYEWGRKICKLNLRLSIIRVSIVYL